MAAVTQNTSQRIESLSPGGGRRLLGEGRQDFREGVDLIGEPVELSMWQARGDQIVVFPVAGRHALGLAGGHCHGAAPAGAG
jgi:hypothetical protein